MNRHFMTLKFSTKVCRRQVEPGQALLCGVQQCDRTAQLERGMTLSRKYGEELIQNTNYHQSADR